jgi:hypothetical protein
MKDCFMGLCIGGGWLTSCSAIGSSTLSSSSSSKLSLGFCRMSAQSLYRFEGWLNSWIEAIA